VPRIASNTRALGLVLALAALFAVPGVASWAEAAKPTVKRLSTPNPTHILLIGNSYLYYGDSVHNHVRRMVDAAGVHKERDLKYKSVTIGGGALHDHVIDSYLELGKLRVKGPFQVVILQGGSALGWSKKRPAVFKATVAEFAAKIRAAGAEPVLYMTHAYVAPHKRVDPGMTAKLEEFYVEAGNANGALVIPVGLAFAEAYKRRPDGRFHKDFDGSHPNLLGTYLAAATVFASIYGQSPVGNSYDYFGEISKEDAAFLQQVAWDTVTRFYGG